MLRYISLKKSNKYISGQLFGEGGKKQNSHKIFFFGISRIKEQLNNFF